jgi:hypothetical protein
LSLGSAPLYYLDVAWEEIGIKGPTLMASESTDVMCFGFFSGGPECKKCPLDKRCRAVLISHGLDIMAGVLDTLMENLPPDSTYEETDLLPEIVNQILLPQRTRPADETEMLALLDGQVIDREEVLDLEGLASKNMSAIRASSVPVGPGTWTGPGPTKTPATDEELDLE